MKIAVCANDPSETSIVANRFGRCDYFVIFDTDSNQYTGIENIAKHESGGAGGKAVAILGKEGVNIVLSPEVGPMALEALEAFEIKAYIYEDGISVQEAINSYFDGKWELYLAPTHKGRHS